MTDELQALQQQVHYLHGLADTVGPQGGEQHELLYGIVDTISALTSYIHDLDAQVESMDEYLQDLDSVLRPEEDLDVREQEDIWQFDCPSCGELLYLDEDPTSPNIEEISCPSCGEVIWTGVTSSGAWFQPEEYEHDYRQWASQDQDRTRRKVRNGI